MSRHRIYLNGKPAWSEPDDDGRTARVYGHGGELVRGSESEYARRARLVREHEARKAAQG